MDEKHYQRDFLLDLCSHVKDCETKTGLSVLPSLQPVFQSAPAVWSIDLSERKTSILLELLKLQPEKKQVELTGCSHEESEVRSLLQCLPFISQLSVDRNQLLRFIHCCAACDVQQEAASGLLRTLQHSLDLSCSSCVELPEEDQTEPLSLTADDCRAVSTILTQGSRDTQLDLRDCEVEDSVLDLLFPVLHRVRLRVSNTVLLQLLSLVPVNSERDAVRRAVSLCTALG
ncbi:uncharacterized protein LOC113014847 [Astatotilapia calliptera]|uniref:uncharacterized protein LOC113014847 n=1 Tax=Astatotilapia calliptera TaxID=8154 RepID=UPI000E415A41|nr:uncharacterized protein LOC113014847 [Astatotilapia calliptera]